MERYNASFYTGLGSDSAMIQAAVYAAAADGEEAVIPCRNMRTGEKRWDIDRTVLLPSGTSLVLVNAHLRMADGICCRMFQNSLEGTPEGRKKSGRQENITIRGKGRSVIDGGVYNGITEKTRGIPGVPLATDNITFCFHNTEHIRIENLTFRDWRYYGMRFQFCSDAVIRDIVFSSHCNVPNQDGIDVHIGCSEFLIENIRGCTGDDAVALTTTALDQMEQEKVEDLSPDIHDVVIRDLNVYAANGCALVRILNHDGYKIYKVTIDGLMEASGWSDDDAVTAPNPDLCGYIDENHRFVLPEKQTPGAFGYRTDAAIRIGENSWYTRFPARPGDTWGIRIRNVTTHAQSALTVANTLWDSLIENVQIFGNGFRAAFFNNGDFRNITFRDLTWASECRPHPEDGTIDIDWNGTHTRGFSAIHFTGSQADGLAFQDMRVGHGFDTVFGGFGGVEFTADQVACMDERTAICTGGEAPDGDAKYRLRLPSREGGTAHCERTR